MMTCIVNHIQGQKFGILNTFWNQYKFLHNFFQKSQTFINNLLHIVNIRIHVRKIFLKQDHSIINDKFEHSSKCLKQYDSMVRVVILDVPGQNHVQKTSGRYIRTSGRYIRWVNFNFLRRQLFLPSQMASMTIRRTATGTP